MAIRTDLAVESLDLSRKMMRQTAGIPGLTERQMEIEGIAVTSLDIAQEAARQIGKPCGRYRTLALSPLLRREENAFAQTCHALQTLLRELMPMLPPKASVLVVGLGNRDITPDAVGPLAAGLVLATRHLTWQAAQYFGSFRPVSVIAPGVLGQTGVESREVLRGLLPTVQPALIVTVDALAAGSLARLCRTVQVTDVGVVPGSGVGNARAALSEETLGVPVLSVGVPTVVDASEIVEQMGEAPTEAVILTTRDIDQQVESAARVIGYGINLALQEGLRVEDIDLYLS